MQPERRRRKIQVRDGSIASRAREGSPYQQHESCLGGQIMEYSGPNLPEDIWCHIHSLMPMRDAAQFACISRSFLQSWRCHPILAFSEETLGLKQRALRKDEKARDFTSKVDHILKNHSGFGVKALRLQVASVYSELDSDLDHLNHWLQIAVKPGIEELNLSLSIMNEAYNFPCSLLSDETVYSLRHLILACCNFHPKVGLGCMRSLTRLHLRAVHITGDEIGCILSTSLALERLEIKYCSEIICLKIPCLQRLSHLEVISCIRLQVIESKATNISSFHFSGELHIQLSLGKGSRIKKLYRSCSDAVFYACTELPSSMSYLETLTVYSEIEMASTPMVPSKFLHLKSLTIGVGGRTYDYFSLASFLHASPFLETFMLNVFLERMEDVSIFEDPSELRKMPEHKHERLKRVDITNFCSAKSLVELTCHIIESTTLLECLTLDTTQGAPRCSVIKSGKCLSMCRDALLEAHRALLAAQTYIKPIVPSKVELSVLEPCRRCHAVEFMPS